MEDSGFVEVTIFGEKYKLLSNYQDREKLLKIVHLVNEKVDALYKKFPKYSKEKVAILTSLNLADELFNIYNGVDSEKKKAYEKVHHIIQLIEHGFE